MTDQASYRDRVDAAVTFVSEALTSKPTLGIVLGTGLGMLVDEIDITRSIEYEDIPHFPVSTVESHHGRLIEGTLDGVPVLVMQGRFHLYEGYTAREVTFPIRVMGQLGIKRMLISNAAGGMNPDYSRGDLMVISDHINLQWDNPLVGENEDDWGPRFPDMSEPYSNRLQDLARRHAKERGISLQTGVYVAVVGPNLETRAEYRFLRRIGADVVGMSTVPETIVARHMGLEVLAMSVVTDECFPDTLQPVSIPEILAAAAEAEPKLTSIFKAVAGSIDA